MFRHDTISASTHINQLLQQKVERSSRRAQIRKTFGDQDFAATAAIILTTPEYFAKDPEFAFLGAWALGAQNARVDFEAFMDTVMKHNSQNTRVLWRILANQRKIYNSGGFYKALEKAVVAVYALDAGSWNWASLFQRLQFLAETKIKTAHKTDILNLYKITDATQEHSQKVVARHLVALEFYYFYDIMRMLQNMADRFKLESPFPITSDIFWDAIIDREDVGQELKALTETGPNVFVHLHSSFNTLSSRIYREFGVNVRAIGKSMYPPTKDDGHMILFQDNKASRLTAFARAYKHMMVSKGNVLLAPDGATGGELGESEVFGVLLQTYSGAATLSDQLKAPCYFIQPEFNEAGIKFGIHQVKTAKPGERKEVFQRAWREGFSKSIEESMSDLDSVPAYPPQFVRYLD